ncbi:transposase [Streptomyces atriruber]|uniref:Transposase n=1 Tax=Streptomyces atriruber TaxID=545121 RepID=A0ABV3BR41_9ACTN
MGDDPERVHTEASFAALCGVSPVEYSSAAGARAGLTTAGTGRRTPTCIASSSPGCATTRAPRCTTNAAPRRARPGVRSSDASSDMPPERSSTWSSRSLPTPCL